MSASLPLCHAVGTGPSGTCYRVLMWTEDALSAEALEDWQTRRRELLGRMRDAGTRGSRGLLASLEAELRELSHRAVEAPLAACTTGPLSYARAKALADALSAENAVLGYRLTPVSAELVVELRGEVGVDELCERWAALLPEVTWHQPALTEALPARQAEQRLSELRREETACAAESAAEEAGEAQAADFHHVTVLREEAVNALRPAAGKRFADVTLGGGGHTELLLEAGAEVWGIDQDPAARAAARRRLARFGERLHIIAGNFRNAATLLAEAGAGELDGLLADIGISSPQVDCAERGFSFLQEGPLDMRMNPAAPRSAADIVNNAPEGELADILWQYGEEKAGRAIARRIAAAREKAPITTTTQLADIIASVLPRKGRNHPATRSFQALRIAVNDELGALEALLESGLGLLKSGGRFAVITFHSLEDRAVKRCFEQLTKPEIDRPEWPAPRPNPAYAARAVFRKPLTAGEAELAANPRSRSAKLRVIEKL